MIQKKGMFLCGEGFRVGMVIKEIMQEKGVLEYRIYRPPEGEEYRIPPGGEKAVSILVAFFPYLTREHDAKGNLALYTQGTDYHIWVKEILERTAEELSKSYPQEIFQVQVDIGEIDEKEIAYRSGLGMRGMNSLIIHEKYGSYGFLGLILTTAHLEAFMTEPRDCLCCMLCKKNCPGQAICGDFTIDTAKCASAISQKKEELSEEEEKILRRAGKVFGCDICQRCCPHNQDVEYTACGEFRKSSVEEEELSSLSGKAFAREYKNRSFAWRGKKIIERNLRLLSSAEGQGKDKE